MLFSEEQKINNIGFKLLFGVVTAFSLVGVFLIEQKGREGSIYDWFLLIAFLVFLLSIYLIVFETKAYTKVDRNGICYKYRPFIWNYKCIGWREIELARVLKIKPIRDFGGWGFRFGGKKGKAIVMSSGYGVVITQKSGKKFTITTQRKLELERVIDFWMNENEKNG